MKNFTDIITMAFMAAAVSASAQVGVMPPKAPLQAGTPNNAAPVASFNPIPTALQQVMTNILFYEDFANGFTGNNGVGSWTAEDTGGGLIWQAVDRSWRRLLCRWDSFRGSSSSGRILDQYRHTEFNHCSQRMDGV